MQLQGIKEELREIKQTEYKRVEDKRKVDVSDDEEHLTNSRKLRAQPKDAVRDSYPTIASLVLFL